MKKRIERKLSLFLTFLILTTSTPIVKTIPTCLAFKCYIDPKIYETVDISYRRSFAGEIATMISEAGFDYDFFRKKINDNRQKIDNCKELTDCLSQIKNVFLCIVDTRWKGTLSEFEFSDKIVKLCLNALEIIININSVFNFNSEIKELLLILKKTKTDLFFENSKEFVICILNSFYLEWEGTRSLLHLLNITRSILIATFKIFIKVLEGTY